MARVERLRLKIGCLGQIRAVKLGQSPVQIERLGKQQLPKIGRLAPDDVVQEQVERRKRAEDAANHREEQDVKFLFPRLDFKRAKRRGETDDRTHQNEADIDTIHADVIADA